MNSLHFFLIFYLSTLALARVDDCPRGCSCVGTVVRCPQQQLQQIPPGIPSETTVLDLRYNKLRLLGSNSFRNLGRLQNLLLNNNEVESIEKDAFAGLSQLRTLHLYHNSIRRIDRSTFEHLSALHTLFLHHNRIDRIDSSAFSAVTRLKRLYLNNNQLRSLPKDIDFGKLDRLRLDSNPFDCHDCQIAPLAEQLRRNPNLEAVPARCESPDSLKGQQLGQLIISDAFAHCTSLPKITQQPPDNVGVRYGETIYLPCKVEGASEIVWMHNETMISRPRQGPFEIMDDGTLMIARANDAVHGYYECMAKSATGATVRTRRALVRIYHGDIVGSGSETGRPRISRQPVDAEVDTGQEVRLHCQAEGRPTPAVTWTKEGSDTVIGHGNVLQITNIQIRHAGVYQCTASNGHGSLSKAEATVRVRFAPEFTLAPEEQEAIEGTRITISCEANGFPTPTIHWTKDGRQLGHSRGITVENRGTRLVIYPFLRQNAGLYVCHARNSLGSKQASADIRVRHSSPPKITLAPANVQTTLGETVNFQCRASGDPQPKIVWLFNGSPVPTIRGHYEISSQNTLYINEVTQADSGHYTCQAANEAGVVSVDATVTISTGNVATSRPRLEGTGFTLGRLRPTSVIVSRELIESSIRKATANVDRAINATRQHLHDGGPKSPSELLALFRFPGPQAIQLARAREIYEQTLRLIQEHVTGGVQFANLSRFQYESILSPAHLQLISELTGCSIHRDPPRCNDMCFHGKYRTYDGTCNNLHKPRLGASLTPFKRLVPAIYENGFDMPVGWDPSKRYAGGFSKPNPRAVSTSIVTTRGRTLVSDSRYSHMLMQWGQFLDHDLDFAILSPSIDEFREGGVSCKTTCQNNPPCFNIDVPDNDPRIDRRRSPVPCIELERSSAVCGSGETSVFFNKVYPREQINQITSFIDASNVYGSNEDDASDLRDLFSDHGLLKFDIASHKQKPYLPFNRDHAMDCRRNRSIEHAIRCFWAGDHRANEQLGLLSMHTLWLREHNRIAGVLLQINPHWDGEKIYQEARKIVGAQMQHITYAHWVPKIIGSKGMKMIGDYRGYDPNADASISNAFATAAFRFGHTLIQPSLARLNASFQSIPEGPIPLHQAFFAPDRLLNEGGIDPLLRGLFATQAKLLRPDQFLNEELTEKLFSKAQMGLDLAALNIQRGRDHALAGYLEYRRWCNLTAPDTFQGLAQDIPDLNLRNKLERWYGHPENIDLWIGALSEKPLPDARIGPTFVCIIADQFRRLRDGDRFWYENTGIFAPLQLNEIRRSSLAKVLCHNGDEIDRVQEDVFLYPGLPDSDQFVSCGNIPDVNLNMWQECCDSTCARATAQLNGNDEDEDEEDERTGRHRYRRSWNENKDSEMEIRLKRLERTVKQLQDNLKSMQHRSCDLEDGSRRGNGEKWDLDQCVSCQCADGRVNCKTMEYCGQTGK